MFEISIIIPTYNRCKLLKRALNSVYNQTFPNYEVIIVDDGSTDGTAEMVALSFPKAKYIYQDNLGVSSARNTGLTVAEGYWIAFLDSDDEWLPDKLEVQINALTQSPKYKICHTEEIWIRRGIRVNQMHKHKKSGGWIFPQCLPLCVMSPSSIIICRTVFENVGDFDTALPACEDYDLWLRISAQYPVHFIKEPLIIKYGGHEDQLSNKHWGMDRFRIKSLQKLITENSLSRVYKQLAISMLLKKCRIFQNGALKRKKMNEVQHYQKIIDHFQQFE